MYHRHVEDLTAFILAGGKSSRMGQDKAFLELAGKTLLARSLVLAHTVTPQVQIVGDLQKFSSFGQVVPDIYPERGPLGGIHAALSATATTLNLIVAVDLPYLTPQFLRYLIHEACASQAMVTLPRAAGGFQPLCAIYQKSFVELAEKSLQAGRNKIDPLFVNVPLRTLEEHELLFHGFGPAMFGNVNTPEEWEKARRALS